MKKIKQLLRVTLFIGVVLSFSSCASSLIDKVSLEGYDNLQMMGFSGLKTNLEFRNESARKIKLSSVEITIKEAGSAIVTLVLKDDFELPRRSEEIIIPTIWKLQDVNLMAALAASKVILAGNAEGFRVDISATVKAGLIKRNVEVKNLLLSELLESAN
ncbi:MAG: hypothetical protein R3Y44_05780 [Rikenellaceae bacterium]